MSADTAAAAGRLDAARKTNTVLNQQVRGQDAQIKADQARIDNLQSILDRQQKALADALSRRKLTQTRYDQLEEQVDDLRAETRAAGMHNKSRAMAKPGTAADPEQQTRLRQLEKRKADLEAARTKLAGRSRTRSGRSTAGLDAELADEQSPAVCFLAHEGRVLGRSGQHHLRADGGLAMPELVAAGCRRAGRGRPIRRLPRRLRQGGSRR